MDYENKLQAIVTLRDLFDFREELRLTKVKYENIFLREDNSTSSKNLNNLSRVEFFLKRVDNQIEYLEKKGVFLSSGIC